jgi:hypothetical protein
VVSILHPVRSYVCTPECGWSGVLASLSGLQRRKRQMRLVFALVVLAAASALFWSRFGDELNWSTVRPPASEGLEEAGGEE